MIDNNRTAPDVPNIGFWTPFIAMGVFLIIAVLVIIYVPIYPKVEQVKYCKIDSVEQFYNTNMVPTTDYRYHTECNFTFTSKKESKIGDSVEVTLIIIE